MLINDNWKFEIINSKLKKIYYLNSLSLSFFLSNLPTLQGTSPSLRTICYSLFNSPSSSKSFASVFCFLPNLINISLSRSADWWWTKVINCFSFSFFTSCSLAFSQLTLTSLLKRECSSQEHGRAHNKIWRKSPETHQFFFFFNSCRFPFKENIIFSKKVHCHYSSSFLIFNPQIQLNSSSKDLEFSIFLILL